MTRKSKAKSEDMEQDIDARQKEQSEELPENGVSEDAAEKSDEPTASGNPTEVDKSEAEVDDLKQQVEELEDKLLRAAAEFENFKKRTARQYEQIVSSAGDRVLGDLLEIVDNFDRAMAHSNGEADIDGLLKGMKLIGNQMNDLLKKYNVEPIEAVGSPFDPSLHEAMMQIASDEHEPGVVAMEIARGYRRGDQVVRHSRVGVSSGPANNDKNEPESGSSEDE